jgi:phage terminase large subunit-like protein
VVSVGLQPILDFEVPATHCYESGGVIHHNTSKTVSAAFEVTGHTTGDYLAWWPGRRFEHPGEWWVAGDTFETTRNIVQLELCGPRDYIRAGQFHGMIPGHLIVDRTLKSGGVSDCIDTLWVKHREYQHGAPCVSTIEFKAYQQGRLSFQGTSKHGIWIDEEPPDASDTPAGGGTPSGNGDVYTECLLRTATTEGVLLTTLTPLRGLTPFLDHVLETSDMCDQNGDVVNAKVGIFGEGETRR